MVFICHVTLQDRDIKVLNDFMVCHHPSKFGGYKHSDIKDYNGFS